MNEPVAPVAYQIVLDPGIDQFREFESLRVHTRINLLGLFFVHKLTFFFFFYPPADGEK